MNTIARHPGQGDGGAKKGATHCKPLQLTATHCNSLQRQDKETAALKRAKLAETKEKIKLEDVKLEQQEQAKQNQLKSYEVYAM